MREDAMKLPTIEGMIAFAFTMNIARCFAQEGEYGAGIVFGLLAIWFLSLRVTLSSVD